MKRLIILSSVWLVLVAACASTEQPIVEDSTTEQVEQTKVVTLATKLEVPWSIQKHDNSFYISERSGTIAKITDGKVQRQTVYLSDELSDVSEAGLLGFLLATNFEESQEAFAYYTYTTQTGTFNKLVKLRLNDSQWEESTVLLDGLPGGNYHDGGRLAIGPDEKLYVTVGDAHQLENVQSLDSLAGTILRLNLDGTIPEDNPYAENYIYSYGHRNPQGLAWTSDDTMYASEHGNSANDEINHIEAGKNYGWPIIEGQDEQAGMEMPLFTSGANTTWAPSGMSVWHDKLYVAALRGNAIFEVNLETKEMGSFLEVYGRIRDVLVEEDTLYFVTNNLDGRGNGEEDDDKLYMIKLNKK
jgi:glucose/arabinose dehydrogenase